MPNRLWVSAFKPEQDDDSEEGFIINFVDRKHNDPTPINPLMHGLRTFLVLKRGSGIGPKWKCGPRSHKFVSTWSAIQSFQLRNLCGSEPCHVCCRLYEAALRHFFACASLLDFPLHRSGSLNARESRTNAHQFEMSDKLQCSQYLNLLSSSLVPTLQPPISFITSHCLTTPYTSPHQ